MRREAELARSAECDNPVQKTASKINAPLCTSLPPKESFEYMVQAVKESRRAEKDLDLAARELILVGLSENIKDSELTQFLQTVSNELNIHGEASSPSSVARLGRLQTSEPAERKRLVKITFPSPESARLYKLAFHKHGGPVRFPFRLRSSLPPQMRHLSKKVFKLNRESDAATSYSLRDDGDIWKFTKHGEKWERDFDWTENSQ